MQQTWETQVLSNMDCEGFQDLDRWCIEKSVEEDLKTIIDDEFCLKYNEDKMCSSELPNSANESPFLWSPQGQTLALSENYQQPQNTEVIEEVYFLDDPDNVSGHVEIVETSALEEEDEQSKAEPEQEVIYIDSDDEASPLISNTKTKVMFSSDVFTQQKQQQCYNWINQIGDFPISQEESVDLNTPIKIENNNNEVIQDIILSEEDTNHVLCGRKMKKLSIDFTPLNQIFKNGALDPVITTPDVVKTIELLELEKQNKLFDNDFITSTPIATPVNIKTEVCDEAEDTISQLTPPDTPRSRKRRRDSEDSDASYVPPQHTKRAKHKLQTHRARLTAELLEYVNKPVKRGRPRKIRDSCDESIISSISSASSDKFRDRRDKNNIASQRSRFKRKEKELLLELEAEELLDKNKNLKISVVSLEEKLKVMHNLLYKTVLNNV